MRLYQLTESINDFSKYLQKKYELTTLFLSDYNGTLELSMLEVPKAARKQGTGTAAMTEIVQYADKQQKRITLTPGSTDDRHGTTSYGRLVKFYKRFGFVENKGRKKDFTTRAGMYRNPQ